MDQLASADGPDADAGGVDVEGPPGISWQVLNSDSINLGPPPQPGDRAGAGGVGGSFRAMVEGGGAAAPELTHRAYARLASRGRPRRVRRTISNSSGVELAEQQAPGTGSSSSRRSHREALVDRISNHVRDASGSGTASAAAASFQARVAAVAAAAQNDSTDVGVGPRGIPVIHIPERALGGEAAAASLVAGDRSDELRRSLRDTLQGFAQSARASMAELRAVDPEEEPRLQTLESRVARALENAREASREMHAARNLRRNRGGPDEVN
jgi:hypothetical protein